MATDSNVRPAANGFIVDVDGATVKITEKTKGALAHVASVDAEMTELSEEAESQIAESLKDGQSIADYAAFDITMYDEDGEKVQPDGDVAVSISGVSTDAEYSEIGIYHLAEKTTGRRSVSMLAALFSDDADDEPSYEIEKVGESSSEALEESGEVQFVADAFSPYVIVFVDNDANFRIKFELRSTTEQNPDGSYYALENLLIADDLILAAQDVVELESVVFKNNMAEFYPTLINGEDPGRNIAYTYSYATFEDDANAEKHPELTRADVTGDDAVETVYLWYTKLSDIALRATVHLTDGSREVDFTDPITGVDLVAGSFYTDEGYTIPSETIKAVLSNADVIDAADGCNFDLDTAAFAQARLRYSDDPNGWYEEVVSGSQNGDNIYVRTKSGQLIAVKEAERSNFELHLFFVAGYTVEVSASTDDPNETGNRVNGQSVTDTTETVVFAENMYNTKSFSIPIEIAEGYDAVITDGDGNEIYNSAEDFNVPQRSTDITETINRSGLSYSVEFRKSELTLDYNYIYRTNWDNGAFHQSTLWINEDTPFLTSGENGNDLRSPVEVSENFTLSIQSIPKNLAHGMYSFRMDSFAVNGTSLRLPNLNNLTSIGDTASVEEVQYLYDQNGDVIASITSISAEVKGQRATSAYVEYKFVFEGVKSWLKITGGNMKNIEFNEIVLRSITPADMVTVSVEDEVFSIGSQKRFENNSSSRSYEFSYSPKDGYYVKSAQVSDTDPNPSMNDEWYGTRTQTISMTSTLYRTLDVTAEPIRYRMRYHNENGEVERISGVDFYLTPEYPTQRFTTTIESSDPTKIFQGWRFVNSADSKVYTAEDLVTREEFLNAHIEPQEEEGLAYIDAYPVFVEKTGANSVQYRIAIICNGEPEENVVFERTGPAGTTIDQGLALEDAEVAAKVRELESTGHQLDYANSTQSITLTENGDNLISLYFNEQPVELILTIDKTAGHIEAMEDNVDADSDGTLHTYGLPGSSRRFRIYPEAGYRPENVTVEGGTVTEFTRGTDSQGAYYEFTYTLPETGIPSDRELSLAVEMAEIITYTLSYDSNGGIGAVPSQEFEEGDTVTVSRGDELSHDAVDNKAVILAGWSETRTGSILTKDDNEPDNLIEKGAILEDTTRDYTLYAVWAFDENGDGIPDYKETKYRVVYDGNGADEGTVPVDTEEYLVEMPVTVQGNTGNLKKNEAVFLGWSQTENALITSQDEEDAAGILGETVDMEEGGLTLYAVWAVDKNEDGTPDYDQYVTLTFESQYGFADVTGNTYTLENQVPGIAIEGTIPTPQDTDDDDVVFVGWNPEIPNAVPSENTTYVAQYKEDKNNNGTPDEDEYVTLTFESEHGFESGITSPYILENQVPGLAIEGTIPTPQDTEDDDVVFVGWNPEIPDVVPSENTTYVAQYKEDRNNNGTPDEDEYVTLTFESEYGFENGITSPYTLENQVPDLAIEGTIPTPQDTDNDDVVFVGWTPEIPDVVPSSDTTYTAQYKEDKNNNGTPDEDEYVTLTFESEYGFADVTGNTYTLENQVPGLAIEGTIPTPQDTDDDEVVFVGWTPEIPDVVPSSDATYTAQYKEDKNNNGEPDENEYVTLTFESEYGFADVTGNTYTLENQVPGLAIEGTIPTPQDTDDDEVVFVGWTPEIPDVVPSSNATYTAQYKEDKNNDGTPDEDEYVTLTFESEYGFADVAGNTHTLENQVPGLVIEGTIPTPQDTEDDGVVFVGWTPEIPDVVPSSNVTYTAQYKEDKNNNGTPDEDEYVTLTFESEYGFESGITSPYTLENQVPGLAIEGAIPTPQDTDNDEVVFVGWTPEIPDVVPSSDTTYTAQYKEDKNNNGTPDEDEYVTLTFESEHGFESGITSPYILENQVPGLAIEGTIPMPQDTEDDEVVFVGWTPEIPGVVPSENTTYVAQYKEDKNNNGTPDEDEYVTLTFESEYGFENGITSPYILENQVPGIAIEGTIPTPQDTEDDEVVFVGWTPEIPDVVPSSNVTYTAQYKEDKNNNGTPDEDEYVTLTFESEYGFEDEITSPYTLENQVPGLAIEGTIPTPQDTEDDGVVFVGWTPEIPDIVPSSNATYTAQYKEDKNNNGTPDEDEYVTLTFESEYGFADVTGNTYTLENQVPGLAIEGTIPTPQDTDDDEVVFVGWTPEIPDVVPSSNVTYTAQYKEDKNNNGTPDEDEYVTLTFESEYGFTDVTGNTYTLENQVPGLAIEGTIPTPQDTEDDGVVFVGWTPEIPDVVPSSNATYTAQYKEDKNNNGTPDEDEYVTLTFESEYGFENGITSPYILENQVPGIAIEGTIPTPQDTEDDGVVFVGWAPEIPGVVPLEDTTYTAQYKEDKNNNGKPDEDEYVTLTFESEYGFENGITSPYILENQVPGLAIEGTIPTPQDTEDDGVVFVGWTPETPGVVPSGDTTYTAQYKEDKNNNGKPDENEYVTLTFESEYGFENGITSPYTLENQVPGLAIEGTIPTPQDTEDDGVVFVGWTPEIPGVVPSGDTTYTAQYKEDKNNNGKPDENEYVTLTFESEYGFENGITSPYILENQVPGLAIAGTIPTPLDTASDGVVFVGWSQEIPNIVPVNNTTYTALYEEDANNDNIPDKDQKYSLFYDTKGGTAVSAQEDILTGSTVTLTREIPTKINAVFEGWTEDGNIPDVILTRSEFNSIVRVTQITMGDADKTVYAVWAVDRNNNGIPDWQDRDDNDGNGGGSSKGNGSGSSYTAGIDGRWVHMDPVDNTKPLTQDVPEGATALTNPEWHQWRFILTNQSGLAGQWAYIRNPYATGDQPGEGWFMFDSNGIMQYGWTLDQNTGKWYYMHQVSDGMLGTMVRGWHQDEQDGRWYYLSQTTGEMLLGWQEIGDKWYYFNPIPQEQTWTYDEKLKIWLYSGSKARPFGSMYQNEETPDGHRVDESGAWVEE